MTETHPGASRADDADPDVEIRDHEQFLVVPFRFIERFLMGRLLTPHQYAVWSALKYFGQRAGRTRVKQGTIADRFGVSRDTVNAAVARFVELGLVEVERHDVWRERPGPDGDVVRTLERRPCTYHLLSIESAIRRLDARERSADGGPDGAAGPGDGAGGLSVKSTTPLSTKPTRVVDETDKGCRPRRQHELHDSELHGSELNTHTGADGDPDPLVELVRAIAVACYALPPDRLMPEDGAACQSAAERCRELGYTAEDVRELVARWAKRDLPYPKQIAREIARRKGAGAVRRGARRAKAPAARAAAPVADRPVELPPWATD